MSETMISGVLTLGGTILGVILGWGLNEISSKRKAMPKLCVSLARTSGDDLLPKERRTKTSPSGYGLEFYNIGGSPYVMESFSVFHGKTLVFDSTKRDHDRSILPFASKTFSLSEQDIDALMWHCRKRKNKKCFVAAFDIRGKKAKLPLDVYEIDLQVEMSQVNPIIED